MANSYEQRVELAMSPEEAVHRLYAALGSLPKAKATRVDGPWVRTTIGMSAFSNGEEVAAHVQPGPQSCLVTIRSNSNFALIDWGKNKKNVETALARMQQPPPAQ